MRCSLHPAPKCLALDEIAELGKFLIFPFHSLYLKHQYKSLEGFLTSLQANCKTFLRGLSILEERNVLIIKLRCHGVESYQPGLAMLIQVYHLIIFFVLS